MRTARLAFLVVPLVLLAILGPTQLTQAAVEIEGPSTPFESTAEISEEGEIEEECFEGSEADEEASENEEGCEAEAEGSGPPSAEDCLLRTTHARVVAIPARNTVRLTLGYTTYAPTPATVEYEARNERLGAVMRHLGRSGVVRLSKHLGDREMGRVGRSGRFTVTVHVSDAPSACRRFESEQLVTEHSSDSRVTWGEGR